MAEPFLEEQLKRMREMSEQMSRAKSNAAELTNEMAREHESHGQDPLRGVRDLRTYISPRPQPKERSDDHAARRPARQPRRRR